MSDGLLSGRCCCCCKWWRLRLHPFVAANFHTPSIVAAWHSLSHPSSLACKRYSCSMDTSECGFTLHDTTWRRSTRSEGHLSRRTSIASCDCIIEYRLYLWLRRRLAATRSPHRGATHRRAGRPDRSDTPQCACCLVARHDRDDRLSCIDYPASDRDPVTCISR